LAHHVLVIPGPVVGPGQNPHDEDSQERRSENDQKN